MSAVKKKNVAKIQTNYVKQHEHAEISASRKRKLLFRRLAAFSVLTIAVSVFMISTLITQSAALEEKSTIKDSLDQELVTLKKQAAILNEEIVKLNDEEYIAKLARKDYFLSEENEIIFNIPDTKKQKNEEKEKSAD